MSEPIPPGGGSLGLPYGEIELRPEGVFSPHFGEGYHTREQALLEGSHVFLDGSDFDERVRGGGDLSIGELGFGLGRNFLLLWERWRLLRTAGQRLHYTGYELAPVHRQDLAEVHSGWSPRRTLSEQLLAQYPFPIRGVHRLRFDRDGLVLDLCFGDANEMVCSRCEPVDIWFADGFSSARNPALWSGGLCEQLRKRTRAGGVLVSYSVSAAFRQSLESVGFCCSKRPGLPPKREMLVAELPGQAERKSHRHPISLDRVAVIGGGLAGTAVTQALARRGVVVTLFDRAGTVAAGASGNELAVIQPHLSSGSDSLTRYSLCAFLSFLSENRLFHVAEEQLFDSRGCLKLVKDDRTRKVTERWPLLQLPEECARIMPVAEVRALTGAATEDSAIFFPFGGVISPRRLCAERLALHSEAITFRSGLNIRKLSRSDVGWLLMSETDKLVGEFSHVVIAGGAESSELCAGNWAELQPVKGQVVSVRTNADLTSLPYALCYDGYVTPSIRESHLLGATFHRGDSSSSISEVDTQSIVNSFAKALPRSSASQVDVSSARASVRAMTLDRLPVIGQAIDPVKFVQRYSDLRKLTEPTDSTVPGVFICTGSGSHGVMGSSLGGEIIASLICGEPMPASADLVHSLRPSRFVARRCRRSGKSKKSAET